LTSLMPTIYVIRQISRELIFQQGSAPVHRALETINLSQLIILSAQIRCKINIAVLFSAHVVQRCFVRNTSVNKVAPPGDKVNTSVFREATDLDCTHCTNLHNFGTLQCRFVLNMSGDFSFINCFIQ